MVAVGGNQPFGGMSLPDTIRAALAAIPRTSIEMVNESFLYSTPCFPMGAGPDYVNAAVSLRLGGAMGAATLLNLLHSIEADFGRQRQARWGARSVDLDLLAFGDMVLPDGATWDHWRGLSPTRQAVEAPNQLILPHPRIQDRAFVLVPLADIAPGWVHPVLKKSVSAMLADLPAADRDAVRRL
ncbi:2-amino-4-hydroxy-6-hydroxymethyldihydropteridine diphosphokinase [Cereibacter sp. SYSU M97828]|nr:2-amino-4-hydroxy-6-hydroxymethyldihydropteridine diphosphokinase [Cereibacter flavus]